MKKLLTALLLTNTLLAAAQSGADEYDVIATTNATKTITTSVDAAEMASIAIEPVIRAKKSNIVYTKVITDLNAVSIEYIKTFVKRTSYINGIYKQGKTFFPKINKVFAKQGIPTELNVIIAIESYFKKDIKSKAGALGYWQFMDATAVEYGLNISDSTKDERKDFDKSTKAAAKYLKNSYRTFNDWYLTVASYNCGPGNVRKAMAKSGKTNPTFFDIKPFLPAETQNYVMKYIALNIIFKNYSNYLSNNLHWETETTPKTEVASNIKKPIQKSIK